MAKKALPSFNWRGRLSEGLVIVVSILLAFAIDAWWSNRNDRAKEQVYLRLIESDLTATLNNNKRFGSRAESIDWRGAQLVRAFYEETPPPADSIAKWLVIADQWWEVQPTLGTVQFLINSGDLRLIQSDSLRKQLPRYLRTMNTFDGFLHQAIESWRESSDELGKRIPISSLELAMLEDDERIARASENPLYSFPPGPLREMPAVDLQKLILDPSVHQVLYQMNARKRGYRNFRQSMRTNTEKMLESVQAELNQ